MIVHKFGGASIKDADSVKRMGDICKKHVKSGIVVVSAMGKSTNLLEQLTQNYFNQQPVNDLLNQFIEAHKTICLNLFAKNNPVFGIIEDYEATLKKKLSNKPGMNYDFEYDQIVPFGELVSSQIVAHYLNSQKIDCEWLDVRGVLKTDNNYREGKVNWELTEKLANEQLKQANQKIYLTQGFIGADINNLTTTLGREGSDYTASVFGTLLNAQKVVVWKDVPGVLCADPAWIPDAEKLDSISYYEAIELAFFGAKVIHPKTIKPLQNKSIPLQVKSFIDLDAPGTIIGDFEKQELPPFYIRKEEQLLVSIMPHDYSFIVEENLSQIFGVFAKHQIKVNLMQNSAVSFSVSIDGEMRRVNLAMEELNKNYNIKYNDNLELITIRHYLPGAEQKVLNSKDILVEQKSRTVARYVIRTNKS